MNRLSVLLRKLLLLTMSISLAGRAAANDNRISESRGAVSQGTVSLQATAPQLRGGTLTLHERAFWSFQPITDPHPPQIDGAEISSDVDRFVMQRIRQARLQPVPPATRRELIRRATFDLTGLPPSPSEMEEFLKDNSADAFNAVVDRLLASPAYGERWGRHWLDVVRYADTAGETADYPTPLAYKYRNWVIAAFNADMPYDQFVRQQIAGDIIADQLLSAERARATAGAFSKKRLAEYEGMRTATGFIAISRRFGFDAENYHHLTIQDTIDVVGQSMLGLTLGCARCHDHKYDPINVEDYYAWYGIFASTRYSFPGSEQKNRPYDLFPVIPGDLAVAKKAEFDARIEALNSEIDRLEKQKNAASLPVDAESGGDTLGSFVANSRLASPAVAENAAVPASIARLAAARDLLVAQRDTLQQLGPYELLYGAVEQEKPDDSRIQLRGEPTHLGEEVPRRNLEILGGDRLTATAGSGRLQLANWLTCDGNPLLARVMANRIWQHHFGRGLISTANDFGVRGERPRHPELLDWLASRFKELNYSVKAMHRQIMNTAAYQRSSTSYAAAAEQDPEARLWWRFNRRRLSAEEIRDAMLFVAGNLDRSLGGEHPFPAVQTWSFTQHNPYYGTYPTNRRSVYLMQQRLKRHPFLAQFDGADTNVSTARRELTTTPTQALLLMNSSFVHEQAAAFARRLTQATSQDAERIDLAHAIAFGRPATQREQREAAMFLTAYGEATMNAQQPADVSRPIAWEAFARTVLARNEFLFID